MIGWRRAAKYLSTTTKDQAISISMGLDSSQLVMAGGIIRITINININLIIITFI